MEYTYIYDYNYVRGRVESEHRKKNIGARPMPTPYLVTLINSHFIH